MKVSEGTPHGLKRMADRYDRGERWISQQAFDEMQDKARDEGGKI